MFVVFDLLFFLYAFCRLQPHASDVCEQELYDLMRISKMRRGDKKRSKRIQHFETNLETYFKENPPLSVSTPPCTVQSVVSDIRDIEEREGLFPLNQKKMVQVLDLWPVSMMAEVGGGKEMPFNKEALLVPVLGEDSAHLVPISSLQQELFDNSRIPVESKEAEQDDI